MHEPVLSKPSQEENDSTAQLDDTKKLETAPEALPEFLKEKNDKNTTAIKPTPAAVQGAVDGPNTAQATLNDNTKKEITCKNKNESGEGVGEMGEAKEVEKGDGDVEMKDSPGTEVAETKEGGPEAMDVDTGGDEKKEENIVDTGASVGGGMASGLSDAPGSVADAEAGLLMLAKGIGGDGMGEKPKETSDKNGKDVGMKEESVQKETVPADVPKKEDETKASENASESNDVAMQDSGATEKNGNNAEPKVNKPEDSTNKGDAAAIATSGASEMTDATPAAAQEDAKPKADKPNDTDDSDDAAAAPSTDAAPSSSSASTPAPVASEASATTDATPAASTRAERPSSASTPATSAPAPPVLRGTLSYNLDLKRHVIRGMWNYENSTTFPPQRFELIRNLDKDEDPKELPKDGEFHGSFSLAYFHTTSKGKQKERSKVIPESGVNIKFTKIDGKDNEYNVDGQGTNQFGVFNIYGTAKPSPHAGEKSYDIELRKKYVPSQVPVAPPVESLGSDAQQSKKTKKRKHNEVEGGSALKDELIADEPEGGPLPPPSQSYPTNVVCLRGKLYREESDDIGLTEVVHRISGLWSSGLDLILADPQNVRGLCNRFEYEHKSTLPNDKFPVSGRYSGWFDLNNPDNTKTRISEKDVTLKFRKNSDGYYNVEGRGSNAFGKYNITGTLTLDNVITIFRHFQQRKSKKSKNSAAPTVTSAPGPLQGIGQAKAAAPPPEPKLKLDDVVLPKNADDSEKLASIPPPAHGTYSAISRGVIRLNDDGAVTCSGKWAMTREHFNNSQTSAFSFRLEPHYAAEAVAAMKKKDEEKKEDTKDGDAASTSSSTASPGAKTFPIDSAMYKGSFQMRRGPSKTTKVIDQQIVLKFRKNSAGSYNVYGKGINSIGEFNLMGTLILSGKSSGHVELYRVYPVPTPPPGQPAAAAVAGKAAGTKTGPKLPTKENSGAKEKASTGIVPGAATGIPKPRPGLQRRESSRLIKLPSRLEDDDPQAQLARIMEKCGQVLRFMHEKDIAHGAFFREPVDPMALGIPTYHRVIKEPMDLGTIQRKLDKGEITTPEEFGRLVRLVFENAMTFNVDPGHAVHQAGRNLLILFNQKFRDLERAVDNIRRTYKPSDAEIKRKEKEEAKKLKRKAKEEKKNRSAKKIRLDEAEAMAASNANAMAALVAAAPSNSAPGGSVTRAEFNMLLQMIQKLQGHVVQTHTLLANLSSSKEPDDSASAAASVMSEGDSEFVPPPEVISRPSGKGKAIKKAAAAKAEKAAMEESKPLSLKEQEALTETINLLPEDRLPGVIQIIRESSTHIGGDEEEIDLEIDQLDTVTQRKLQRYVLQVRLTRSYWKACLLAVMQLAFVFDKS